MGISLINLERNFPLDKSAYRIINCFCGVAATGGLFLLLIAPDAIKPKVNKFAGTLAWLGGVCSSISLIACGVYLRDKEKLVSVVEKQELQLLHHQLSTSRILIEKQREQAMVAILEGQELIEDNHPLPIAPMPQVSPTPAVKQTPKHPLPPAPNSFEERKQQLWVLIQSDAEWLGKLLKRKPLLVVGPQGSGKTTFVKFLALLRALFLGHEIKVSDPHAHNNDWLESWEIAGANYDYKAIDKALKGYFDRLKSSKIQTTSIWDECTNYAENCQSECAEKFLKSVLADSRKSNEFPILLSHGETLSNLGGGKGGANKMKQEGLTTLKLLRKSDEMGEDRPAFKGYLSGLDYAEDGQPISYSVELNPEWMNPQYLLKIFPELMSQTEAQDESTGNNIISTPVGKFDLNKSENTKSLEELESEILAFCVDKGTATVREIQNKFKSLGIKAETIKFILKELEDKGLGSVSIRKVGGAESMSFTALPTPDVDG